MTTTSSAASPEQVARVTALDGYRRWAAVTSSERPFISVVIPAYNEAERILPTIGAVAAHFCQQDQPWELLVADDGSRDNTVGLLNDLQLANLTVLETDRNRGKGSAVRRGMRAARGGYVLFLDADQSTPVEQIDQALSVMRAGGHDVLVGSRAADGAAVHGKSVVRRIFSWGLHTVVKVFFGIRVRDTQCGFKLFTADAAAALFDRQVVDGFSFDLELIYLAGKLGYSVAEMPVEWHDAPGSTVSATRVALRFLADLAAIRLRDLRGGYAAPARS